MPFGSEGLQPGIGLALSGGGFRATLFHLGSLWRLNELGYLPKLDRKRRTGRGRLCHLPFTDCKNGSGREAPDRAQDKGIRREGERAGKRAGGPGEQDRLAGRDQEAENDGAHHA